VISDIGRGLGHHRREDLSVVMWASQWKGPVKPGSCMMMYDIIMASW
jgi:hypothetical protein